MAVIAAQSDISRPEADFAAAVVTLCQHLRSNSSSSSSSASSSSNNYSFARTSTTKRSVCNESYKKSPRNNTNNTPTDNHKQNHNIDNNNQQNHINNNKHFNLKNLASWVKGCYSVSLKKQIESVTNIRQLLSTEADPPIEEVIASGVVPKLVEFLYSTSNERLQFESAWSITNIASGTSENTSCVVKYGAIKHLKRLIGSKNVNVSEQAAWACGNICGDCDYLRDKCLSEGCLNELIKVIDKTKVNVNCFINKHRKQIKNNNNNNDNSNIKKVIRAAVDDGYGVIDGDGLKLLEVIGKDEGFKALVSLLGNISWTMSNMVRGNEAPEMKYIKEWILSTSEFIRLLPDDNLNSNLCWGIYWIVGGHSTDNVAPKTNNTTNVAKRQDDLGGCDQSGLSMSADASGHNSTEKQRLRFVF